MLAACEPLITPKIVAKMKHISIPVIPEQSGQYLRALLYQRLGSHGEKPAYFLAISMETKNHRLEMGGDERFHTLESVLKLSYELIRARDKKLIEKDFIWVSTNNFLTKNVYARTSFDAFVLERNIEWAAHLLFERIAVALSRER